jgi:four helix bundle protein
LTDQMRRAAVSVPSNIAEGQAHYTDREFRHFLRRSRGSLAELETQVMIARQRN